MTALKKLFSIVVCIALLLALCGNTVFADKNEEITISDVTGNAGDTVIICVNIKKSELFSQVGFALKYNKSLLQYKGYYSGILNDYNIYDHSEDGYISFSSIQEEDIDAYGNLVVFEFRIKDTAKNGKYKISLSNVKFKNKNGKSVKIKSNNGVLKVTSPCKDEHDYGKWGISALENCTDYGIKVRYCEVCGHTETEKIEPSCHDLEETFTVDVVAKDGKKGMLSRHCKVCGAKTDVIVYDEKSTAALTINDVIEYLDEDTVTNLVYYLNGFKTYPDIAAGDFDEREFIKSGEKVFYSDKSVDVGAAIDRVLRKVFGNDKKSGIIGALKRAELAGEISLKTVIKLIQVVLF